MAEDERKIVVQYFAMLREEAGVSEEDVLTSQTSAQELFEELRTRHGFTIDTTNLKLVVNEEFRDWSHPLSDGDTIVFIPPVAGG